MRDSPSQQQGHHKMKKVRRGKMLKPYQEYLVSDEFVRLGIKYNIIAFATLILLHSTI